MKTYFPKGRFNLLITTLRVTLKLDYLKVISEVLLKCSSVWSLCYQSSTSDNLLSSLSCVNYIYPFQFDSFRFLGRRAIHSQIILSHFSFPTESSVIFTFLSDFAKVSKSRAPGQLSRCPPEEHLGITPVHVWAIFTKASSFLFPIDYFCLFCCWILNIEDRFFLFCVIFQVIFHFCPPLSAVFSTTFIIWHFLRWID